MGGGTNGKGCSSVRKHAHVHVSVHAVKGSGDF